MATKCQCSFAKLIQSFAQHTLHAKVGTNPQQLLRMAIYHLSNNGDYVIDSSQQWVIKMMVVLAMASGDLQVLSQQGSLKNLQIMYSFIRLSLSLVAIIYQPFFFLFLLLSQISVERSLMLPFACSVARSNNPKSTGL